MKKLVFALALLLPAVSALHAQSVQQSGNVSPNHVSIWATNGVIKDGGTASNPFATSFGVVGGSICVNSGPITGAYNALCFTATLANGGVVSIYNYGGATGGLSFVVNGVAQGLPLVPLPTTTNDPVCFANSSGSLKDCGFTFTGFANPTASIGLVAVNGAATTALRSDSAPPLSASVQSALTQPLNQILLGTGAFGFSSSTTLPTSAFANPTASIGLAAINGSAVTTMRSDAAPALNQAINPTWTGAHTFNGNIRYTGTPQQFFLATTGNDSNDCLTNGTACLTLQHVINVAFTYDAKNVRQVINIAAGTYTTGALIAGHIRGEGTQGTVPGLEIAGASATTVILDDNTGNCGTIIASGTSLYIHDVTIKKTSGCGGGGSGIFAQGVTYVAIGNVIFGAAGTSGGQHVHVEGNSEVEVVGAYTINGNASYHIGASHGGDYIVDGKAITCGVSTTAFTAFVLAQTDGKVVFLNGTSFTSCGSVTGIKWQAQANGVVDADGATGLINSIPGNVAGNSSLGGLYTPAITGTIPALGYTVGVQINFNASSSDTPVTIPIPSGITRYRVSTVSISGASTSLTTATVGIFTSTGGGGIAIVTGGSVITVSTAAEQTNNNTQYLAVNNATTISYTTTTLYIRVGTAEGVPATGIVSIGIVPLS